MNEHRYILEPYNGIKTRYLCPNCGKEKNFSLYIDTETGEHLNPTVGRCNAEINCGYHYTPKQYFQDNDISFDATQPKAYKPRSVTPQQKPVSFIPVKVFKASLNPTAFEKNHFVKFLIDLFGVEVASELVSRYFIGTSKHWNGATVFWQIDINGKVRTGKIMLYSPTTGKRVKEPFSYITWVHKAIKQPEFELKQCLFGEHLLKVEKNKPVAIVESEKTAIIASVYLPQFVWVAVGSLTNLNVEKCSILKGRTVILFPDLKGFEKWSNKAKELSNITQFTVSDLLERKTTETEKKEGFDLADYLIKFNYKEFALIASEATEQPLNIQSFVDEQSENENLTKPNISETLTNINLWDNEIKELENFFAGVTLPNQPVKLNQCSTITDINIFIESHFATVKANNGKKSFLPYLNRLQELKQVLTNNYN